MKTALPTVCRVCLIGFMCGSGCISETEGPHASSADHTTTGEKSASESVADEIIPVVAVREITKTSTEKRSCEYHKVEEGETLSMIAARCHTTAEQLARANGLGQPDQLAVGQWLYLPRESH